MVWEAFPRRVPPCSTTASSDTSGTLQPVDPHAMRGSVVHMPAKALRTQLGMVECFFTTAALSTRVNRLSRLRLAQDSVPSTHEGGIASGPDQRFAAPSFDQRPTLLFFRDSGKLRQSIRGTLPQHYYHRPQTGL